VKTYSAFYGNQIHQSETSVDRAYFGEPMRSVQVNQTRPEDRPKPVLKFCYRLEIRPGAALQDPLDARVVNASEFFSTAEAHAVHGSLQVQDELPGDLAAGVVGGHVGPFLRAFAGRGAERPGHDSSVDDTEGAAE